MGIHAKGTMKVPELAAADRLLASRGVALTLSVITGVWDHPDAKTGDEISQIETSDDFGHRIVITLSTVRSLVKHPEVRDDLVKLLHSFAGYLEGLRSVPDDDDEAAKSADA